MLKSKPINLLSSFAVLLILCSYQSIFAQSDMFDFEDATFIGGKVYQTKDGVQITVSHPSNNLTGLFDYTLTGFSSETVLGAIDVYSLVLDFNTTVKITTIQIGNAPEIDKVWKFISNNGDVVRASNGGTSGAVVSLNFINITSITIQDTTGTGNSQILLDNVVMDAALPVELTTFTANVEKNSVNLFWQTATEVNNYGFEIERSVGQAISLSTGESELSNGWERIGFVPGSGNSSSPKEYSFIDKDKDKDGDRDKDYDKDKEYDVIRYRLKQIDTDGSYEYSKVVEVTINAQPAGFSLEQNYPNPFNPATSIRYTIPEKALLNQGTVPVKLVVYNVLGSKVAELVNDNLPAGTYTVDFKAASGGRLLPSGMYFYNLTAGNFSTTKKMTFIK
jgi:hypothetical protein